jgi:hypothetical protein
MVYHLHAVLKFNDALVGLGDAQGLIPDVGSDSLLFHPNDIRSQVNPRNPFQSLVFIAPVINPRTQSLGFKRAVCVILPEGSGPLEP